MWQVSIFYEYKKSMKVCTLYTAILLPAVKAVVCGSATFYSLAEQGTSSEAVQELGAAALVEVKSRQGDGDLLQLEEHAGPAVRFDRDGTQVTDAEGECPAVPLVTVVHCT